MPPKAKFSQERTSSRPTENLPVTRLAVTLSRDSGWLNAIPEVGNIMLYIGMSKETTLSMLSNIGSLRNPFGLSQLFEFLYARGKLAEFFTEMLRLKLFPENIDEFRSHLQPLGLDWYEETNRVQFTTTRPEAERHLRTVLESLLDEVSPEFPRMLNGAWDAYYSDNPDKYRQTISSCRELLNQVITKLSKSESERLERKERVRRILGSKHKTELVESAAELVSVIYNVQSAEEHTSPEGPTALFVLAETEHILYFLLTHSQAIRQENQTTKKQQQ